MKHAVAPVVEFPRAPLSPPLRSLAVAVPLFGRIGPLACALAVLLLALPASAITIDFETLQFISIIM
jgi:hypothetical protein